MDLVEEPSLLAGVLSEVEQAEVRRLQAMCSLRRMGAERRVLEVER